jgi:hypothetical protein
MLYYLLVPNMCLRKRLPCCRPVCHG